MRGTVLEIRCREPRRAVATLREKLQGDSVGLFGDRVHVVTGSPQSTTERAATILSDAGFPVSGIRTVEPSLEDVFVSVLAGREGGGQ